MKAKALRGLSLMALLTLCMSGGITASTPATAQEPIDPNHLVSLQYGDIDTRMGEPTLERALRVEAYSPDEAGYYIVQFTGAILPQWKVAVEETGAEMLGYVPNNAFIVRMTADQGELVAGLEQVQWIGIYQPAYCIAPWMPSRESGEETLVVLTFDGADFGQVVAQLEAWGGKVVATSENDFGGKVRVVVDLSHVPDIAQINGVMWIEPWLEPQLANDVARGIMDVEDTVWDTHGLYGAGQIVAVADTGLDVGNHSSMSDDFEGRIVNAHCRGRTTPCDWSDPNGHGTHVAGSAVGNGRNSGSSPGIHDYAGSSAGVAPEAELVFQSIMGDDQDNLSGLPSNLNDLFQQAYNDGARVHTNSWGGIPRFAWFFPNPGAYDSSAFEADQFAWTHPDMVLVFAAGNDGVDDNGDGIVDLDAMNSPGTAKNVITVGATESLRPSGGWTDRWGDHLPSRYPVDPIHNDYVSSNYGGMAAFSSRGPVDGSRIKPDLVAPGTNILSARTHKHTMNMDAESGIDGWVPTAPWAITASTAHAGTYSWSTGSYANNLDVALTSPAMDIRTGANTIGFWTRYDLGNGDVGRAEYYDGTQWQLCTELSGLIATWQFRSCELPALSDTAQESFRIRFRLVSDSTDVGTGWFLDDIQVTPGGWGFHLQAGSPDPDYIFFGGTSMATPFVAGSAALVREYYDDLGHNPSSALVKATLINGAVDISPGQYGEGSTQEIPDIRPNNVAGWGRVNVQESLFPDTPKVIHYHDLNNTDGLNTGETHVYRYRVQDTTVPVRVSLVWTDYPSFPWVGSQINNDLDLAVRSPDRDLFHPNGQDANDSRNNIEDIFIDQADVTAGTFVITVHGRNVPNGPQGYALVVRGGELTADPVTRDELAEHYAPVWYQDTDSSDYDADYITNFDFDYDWRGSNNWYNQQYWRLNAYVYFSVIETESHWFILYADFHPRDWTEICTSLLCHENDMEGAILAIRKMDESPYGELQLIATQAHGTWHRYTSDQVELIAPDQHSGASQPALFVEAKGHGVYAWDMDEFPGEDGVVYRYFGVAEEPLSGNDRAVGYALRPLDELWRRRYCSGDGRAFDSASGDFVLGTAFDGDDHSDDAAHPPWGWDGGEPFWDPVEFFKSQFSAEELGDNFSEVYVDNPYQNYISDSARRTEGNEIEKGLCYLSLAQHADGNWSNNVAITSMDVLAYLNAGYPENDPDVSAAIQYLLANQHDNGSIHNDSNRATYHTGLALLPLKATQNDEYADEISVARDWLVKSQWDDSNWWWPVSPSSWYWGGFGYGNSSRPDLSNTQFALLGLDASDLPNPDMDDTWNKAVQFVSRCQEDSGGFAYTPPNSTVFGSMTGAGIWGLALAGFTPDDSRFEAALDWVEAHYTWDQNPGEGTTALYYYYLSMSKALSMARRTTIAGNDWFADLKAKLSSTQRSDGSWYNYNSSLWENNRDLVTGYALLSLQTRTLPEEAVDLELVIILHSPADLHLFDAEGRHVGKNYGTGGIDLEVPGSSYSPDDPQTISIHPPVAGNYHLELIGTGEGDWQIEIIGLQDGTQISYDSYAGSITPGAVLATDLNVGAFEGALTIFSSQPAAAPVLEVAPASLSLTGQPGVVLDTSFTVSETGGNTGIQGVGIFATDLTDGSGNSIPGANVSFDPNNFDLDPGASQSVDVSVSVPGDAPDGDYSGSITVESLNAGTKSVQLTVEVRSNTPPTADANGPYHGNEGEPVTLDASASSDPDENITLYEWDLDNDGEYDDAVGVNPEVVFYQDGTYPIGLKVTDEYGESDTDATEVQVDNVAPGVTADVTSQEVQYSDYIADVTVTATDVAGDPLHLVGTEWKLNDGVFEDGLPDDLELTDDGCSIEDHNNTCDWTLSGIINQMPGDYTVRVTIADDVDESNYVDIAITVLPEKASVAFADANPVSERVIEDGGNSGPFSLAVTVSEKEPDLPEGSSAPGDIGLAQVSMSLVPVGPGGAVNGSCAADTVIGTGYDAELPVTCGFDDVPVNAYSVQVTVDGGYYAGYAEDVVVVYDPSLGFATGGGWFYWPGSTEKTNFGFTMKYNKKATKVQGNLLLIRHVGDELIYRVKSNALYGLALGGEPAVPMGWASFHGKCTYMDPSGYEHGNYEFVVYVEDRDEPGQGVDRVWIEVLDNNGNLVTVMSMDRPGTDNAVELGGGNVAVPH